ncbi:MAG: hypothetical protein FJ290_25825 [Planctomycetes bacterium]|nr:hypothetical protein [Planctomycetota bacterium]
MSRVRSLLLGWMLAVLVPAASVADGPYAISPEEKAGAGQIQRAVEAGTQASVETLVGLVRHENPRVQTAALLGLLRLANAPLDFAAALDAAKGLKDSKQAFVAAAADVALIALDRQVPIAERRARLVKLTESREGRGPLRATDRATVPPPAECKEGYQRRMAAEALRAIGDASVLPALEAMADDSFGESGDSLDRKAGSGVAFHAWWAIRSQGLPEEEKLRVLAGALRHGEPFGSRWSDAACRLLAGAGEPAVPVLIPLARGEDRRSKLWALRTLRDFSTSQSARDVVIEVCAKDIESEDRLVRQSAAFTLRELADRKSVPVLARALAASPDPYVRERAAFTLGRIEDEGTLAPLKAALSDADWGVKTQAAAHLARRGFRDGEPVLLDALGEREGTAGSIAVGALEFIQDRERLAERLAALLRKQPGEEQLAARPRILLDEARNRILRQLATWDPEKLRPGAPALKPVLANHLRPDLVQAVLKKLGD